MFTVVKVKEIRYAFVYYMYLFL